MDSTKTKSRICWTIAWILGIAWAIIALTPFIFMVLNSFKGQFEMLTKGVFSLPESFNLSNYKGAFEGHIIKYFLNSVVVMVVALSILLFTAACASYPLSRFKFKLANPIYSLVVACMAIPVHITLIPIFKMSTQIGIYDSIWALIGPYIAMNIPISVFILTSFMKGIPGEIEEAAEIDGCNKFSMFFRVILPLSKPGLATLAIYNGVNIWNEFIFAYTLTQSAGSRTLPIAVSQFKGEFAMNTPMILAVLTLSIIPMIILFIIMQDKLVKGMTAGAVKG